MNNPVIPISKIRNVIAGLLPAGHPTLVTAAQQLVSVRARYSGSWQPRT
jgi:hypothetical protein